MGLENKSRDVHLWDALRWQSIYLVSFLFAYISSRYGACVFELTRKETILNVVSFWDDTWFVYTHIYMYLQYTYMHKIALINIGNIVISGTPFTFTKL